MTAYLRTLLTAGLVLVCTSFAYSQTTRTVCTSGCTTTSFQTAIDASVCGDTITLKFDETFTGNWVLTNTATCAANNRILIRSSTADGNLPAVGVRAGTGRTYLVDGVNITAPDHTPFMPNIKASAGGLPALRTATGARGYTILGLEFLPNPLGYNVIVELGQNTVAQRLTTEQPKDITVDRSIISGDDVYGQKVGIDLSGQNLAITNSWVEKICGLGQDAVGVRGINGTGPHLIENNFIEACAENTIFGGDDPWMMNSADVNAGATTTTATLASFADRGGTAFGSIATLKVGQRIAFLAGANTARHHTKVLSCGGATTPGTVCSSNTIIYEAIPSAPDTGAGAASDVRWGELADGITYRRNHFYKNLAWKNPIIGALGTVIATPSTTGGTMTAGTKYYRVTPYNNEGYIGNNAYGTTSVEINTPTTGTTGSVALSWPAVPNATHYRVFRGTAAGTYTGYLLATGTTALTDTGAALTTGTIPGASKWVVKVLFEIKNGRNILVEDNVLENSWGGQGDSFGQCAWLKASNQGSSCEFCETVNVTWRRNICRNTNGFLSLLASDWPAVSNSRNPSMENVTFSHSLFQNSIAPPAVDSIRVNGDIKGLVIDHNTFTNSARGFIYFTTSTKTPSPVFSNNVSPAATYGIFGLGCSIGSDCLVKSTTGTPVFEGNVIGGVSGTNYPVNNLYPTLASFATNFVNYDNGVRGDYNLATDSVWLLTGTDGLDRGANMSAVLTGTNGVVTGTPSGPAPPPTITTLALSPGTVGVAFSQQLFAQDGVAPYTWSVVSGSLPGSAALSSAGLLTWASPTLSATTFTVRATDSTPTTALTDDQVLTLTINAAPVALNITTGSPLTGGTVPLPYDSVQLAATGGSAPYTWAVTSGTLPAGITLSTDGLLSGVPTTAGVASFTVTVTDSVAATDPQAYSLTIVAEAPGCSRGTTIVGGITLEGARFVGPVAPTVCVKVGDTWGNTSVSPPRENVALTSSPAATWTPVSGIVNATHDILSSSHTDTIPGTLQAGDVLVATEDALGAIKFARRAVGVAGTVATSTGDGVDWLPPAPSAAASSCGRPVLPFHTPASTTTSWTQPLAETDFIGIVHKRHQFDATPCNEVRIHMRVAAASSSANTPKCYTKYALTTSGTWTTIATDVSLAAIGSISSSWVALPAAAKADMFFQIYCSGGDGTVIPAFGATTMQFR